MLTVFIDADGCPVKDETYRVAKRYGFAVRVVANHHVNVPLSPSVQAVRVGSAMDEADDWIAAQAGTGDIVVTADIPLAARCLAQGARVLGVSGREFTESGIGNAMASRELAQQLREMGIRTGGPAPLEQKDRSRFLSSLDQIAGAIRRGRPPE